MLARLAVRNVKRQIGNYLIYFLTVMITVCLLFAIDNAIYAKELQQRATSETAQSGLLAVVVVVALIAAFVLAYANYYMLHLRKREFGTYMTLGMTRVNVLRLFLSETTILCLAALVLGTILGLAVYQVIMAAAQKLMDMRIEMSSYTPRALFLTLVVVIGMFVLSAVTSILYLRRVSIFELMNGKNKKKKPVRHPVLWLVVCILSVAAMLFSYEQIHQFFEDVCAGKEGSQIVGWCILLITGIFFFHTGLAKGIVAVLLRNKKFCAKGSNTFVLRQLSSQLSTNAVLTGILAVLIAAAAMGANISLGQRALNEESIRETYPFSMMGYEPVGVPGKYTFDEAANKAEEYTEITARYAYTIYSTGKNEIYSHTPWSGDGFDGLYDSVILESDYNALMRLIGKKEITLAQGEFTLVNNFENLGDSISDSSLTLGDKNYHYNNTMVYEAIGYDAYFFAVVPDEAKEYLEPEAYYEAFMFASDDYDAERLMMDLTYEVDSGGGYFISYSNFELRQFERLEAQRNSCVFIIGELYISIVFVLLSMAILALKVLTGLNEDKLAYDILDRLGMDETMRRKALFAQTFLFFLLPFLLPVLMCIPAAKFVTMLMTASGFVGAHLEIWVTTGWLMLAFTVLYFLYYVATFEICRKNLRIVEKP